MPDNAPRPGLAIVAIDPGEDFAGLRAWYESERIPAVLAVPGVSGVAKWEVISRYGRTPQGNQAELPAPPTYVVIYELDDVVVARDTEFLDAVGRDFRQVATIRGAEVAFDQVMNITLALIAEDISAEAATAQARGMMVVSYTPRREYIAMFHEWYDTVHVPELMSCPGFLRTRRFRALDGIPNFFAMYELDDPEALHGERFRAFSGRTLEELPELKRTLLPNKTGNICDVYRLLD
jgi:hypothetical protein